MLIQKNHCLSKYKPEKEHSSFKTNLTNKYLRKLSASAYRLMWGVHNLLYRYWLLNIILTHVQEDDILAWRERFLNYWSKGKSCYTLLCALRLWNECPTQWLPYCLRTSSTYLSPHPFLGLYHMESSDISNDTESTMPKKQNKGKK